jgi:hypothetical protein
MALPSFKYVWSRGRKYFCALNYFTSLLIIKHSFNFSF